MPIHSNADQQIDDLIARHESSWRLGYHAFPAVLNRLGLKRGAEIGVAFGGHSEAILQHTGVEKLYAIDSYRHRPEYEDPMNLSQHVFDRLYERTGQRLSVFGNRVQQIRLDSVQAAEKIDESLDFVYIDGDHSYQGVRDDIEAWFRVIREGGIIAGHDYGQPAFPGVKAVVDHFFQRFGATVHHEGKGVWWAQRPETPVTLMIVVHREAYCDATRYDQLVAAGLTADDTVMLVHDEDYGCDAATRVLAKHPRVEIQPIQQLRGTWHAAVSLCEHVQTPMVLPIQLDSPLAKGEISVLRDRLCRSGAMAAALSHGHNTRDFALADLLATPTMPRQVLVMTTALRQATRSSTGLMEQASERLILWLVMADMLARGGRIALEPGQMDSTTGLWTTEDCQRAALKVLSFAQLVDGTDLLRLKWPSFASNWLNLLDRKPMRTRVNVRPVDVQPTHMTPSIIDRVVHKFRRAVKGAA